MENQISIEKIKQGAWSTFSRSTTSTVLIVLLVLGFYVLLFFVTTFTLKVYIVTRGVIIMLTAAGYLFFYLKTLKFVRNSIEVSRFWQEKYLQEIIDNFDGLTANTEIKIRQITASAEKEINILEQELKNRENERDNARLLLLQSKPELP